MKITELNGKRVCIVGYGVEGRASLVAVKKYSPNAVITVADTREDLTIEGVALKLGPTYLDELAEFDVIIKTPGISYLKFDESVWDKLTSATALFLDTVRASGAVTIGITGSKGKSTTSSLIAAVLKRSGEVTYLIGNIGRPMLEYLDEAKAGTYFVMELSSHQLERLPSSPHIAVVTSFFPEHLDFYPDVEAYFDAKATIGRYQTEKDWFYFNDSSAPCVKMSRLSQAGHKQGFDASDSPVDISETKLLGEHNASNMGAACLVTRQLGVTDDVIVSALKDFDGLPHRLESLGTAHGIEWVDDVISTTPESTMAAMDALGDKLGSVILGGQDRGLEFGELGEYIASSKLSGIILYGATGSRIELAIRASTGENRMIAVRTASDMTEVVAAGVELTPPGKICLLSPAAASYDMYDHFETKGDEFARTIKQGS